MLDAEVCEVRGLDPFCIPPSPFQFLMIVCGGRDKVRAVATVILLLKSSVATLYQNVIVYCQLATIDT